MQFIEITTALKDIALAGAAIVTATVAWKGLNKWREELRGKVDFEVARGLVRATYKLRDELQSARAPMIRGSEFPDSYTGPGQASPQDEARAWAHVYRNRWQPVAEAAQEFEAQALEAEALWGADIRELTKALRQCAHNLSVSMEAVIDDKAESGRNFASDKDFGRQVQADVSAHASAQGNPLSEQIQKAVTDLENKLKSHLRRD